MRTLPANGPGLFLSVHQKVPKLVLECQRQARESNSFKARFWTFCRNAAR
jgi:hypothetical protein